MTHAQSSGAQGPVKWSLDIVLEDTLAAVVCETFAKLNDRYQEDGERQRFANVTKRGFLIFGWFSTFRRFNRRLINVCTGRHRFFVVQRNICSGCYWLIVSERYR